MSNIFSYLVRDTGGIINLNLGTGPIPLNKIASQGLNIDESGAVYSEDGGIAARYHSGLPFTINGRLVVNSLGDVSYVDQSIPFDGNNRVLFGGAVASVSQGLAYDAQSKLATTI